MPCRELHWPKNFAISSFAKIDLTGITTGKYLPKINSASKLRSFAKLLPKLPKILTKILTKIRFETPDYIFKIFVITETNGILHGNFENQQYKQRLSI